VKFCIEKFGYPKYIYIYIFIYIYNKYITILPYLLTENFNGEYENAPKQNNISKLPDLKVVLQRIDEVSQEETIKITSKESSKKRRKIKI